MYFILFSSFLHYSFFSKKQLKVCSCTHLQVMNEMHRNTVTKMTAKYQCIFGPQLLAFVKKLGRKLSYQTGEEKAATYLIQRLSMAVQLGNAISFLGGLSSQHCT